MINDIERRTFWDEIEKIKLQSTQEKPEIKNDEEVEKNEDEINLDNKPNQ